ncbi:cardiolipin synthase [Rubrivivax gelatinosus]|uniref:cardiolipin synthase ClsB n=2 Tax=Rubrivivax gelatinosus TaxID=28068 RepID=UPI0018C9E091|nr:cardiolipin synthase ClsB [Rubrivivax gelatinosus]MBG6080340.1 cardiolipin synthase [Rubrivivax gelatinosus]
MKRRPRWQDGNAVELLENGEAFFPAVFDAIRNARHEVLLETFILFEDKVGLALHAALLEAAQRGVQVDVMVDGFGSPDLSPEFTGSLRAAGVRLRSFDPSWRLFGKRFNVLRRMHRKIVVVDGETAFVGGINYSADHLADYGPEAKQDYSVRLRGPVVETIRQFAIGAIRGGTRGEPPVQRPRLPPPRAEGPVQAMLVTRDNLEHRADIERQYRAALRAARHSVIIANAYFFPGWRFLKELRRAARRGVDVRLILQGTPDMPIVKTAAGLLYDHLLRDGVHIHEYCDRPMHGKVAVVDEDWATVGSSNLDPLSLSLNLEANVILRDRGFAAQLRERLQHLIRHSCEEVQPEPTPRWRLWVRMRSYFVLRFAQRFPLWARVLPAHRPTLELVEAPPGAAPAPAERADEARGLHVG